MVGWGATPGWSGLHQAGCGSGSGRAEIPEEVVEGRECAKLPEKLPMPRAVASRVFSHWDDKLEEVEGLCMVL